MNKHKETNNNNNNNKTKKKIMNSKINKESRNIDHSLR